MCETFVPISAQDRHDAVEYPAMGIEMNKVSVVIETARHQICGNVAVPAVSRLSDYANDPQRRFWAVTEAEISSLEHPDRARSVPFILIAAHEIGIISPISSHEPAAARLAQPADYAPMDEFARAVAALEG